MEQSDARLKPFVTVILKQNKNLNEREVKAAVRKGLKLRGEPVGSRAIRQVRKHLGASSSAEPDFVEEDGACA